MFESAPRDKNNRIREDVDGTPYTHMLVDRKPEMPGWA